MLEDLGFSFTSANAPPLLVCHYRQSSRTAAIMDLAKRVFVGIVVAGFASLLVLSPYADDAGQLGTSGPNAYLADFGVYDADSWSGSFVSTRNAARWERLALQLMRPSQTWPPPGGLFLWDKHAADPRVGSLVWWADFLDS